MQSGFTVAGSFSLVVVGPREDGAIQADFSVTMPLALAVAEYVAIGGKGLPLKGPGAAIAVGSLGRPKVKALLGDWPKAVIANSRVTKSNVVFVCHSKLPFITSYETVRHMFFLASTRLLRLLRPFRLIDCRTNP